ncbi:DUF3986 family protein [Halobacillus sp. A5]|uniref:DUF3986 family protein n=1 Tax=Halobacillus sp. A5 TaxID=2880263 RepID=UPI0020A645FE|nr:DUF3986 family protein [Halobacillus sp. A5]MCP3027054.1 DUF3986 family protein [Halobacillus sp. A5]
MYVLHQHYHIGYYEEGHDLEVVAYKRKREDIWDVFIEDYEPGEFFKSVLEKELGIHVKNYGLLIFSICGQNLSDEEAFQKFEDWLITNKVIRASQ